MRVGATWLTPESTYNPIKEVVTGTTLTDNGA